MDHIFRFIQQIGLSPWLGLLSFVIALVSIFLAVLFYFKSLRAKKPRYSKRTINLVRGLVSRFESLEILYAGQKIENLSVTRIAFWNAGAETMLDHDIASADPISIQSNENCAVLDAQKIFEKNSANKISLRKSPSDPHFYVEFEYIDRNEGAIFQIIHTGISDDELVMQGKIKGAGDIKEWKPSIVENVLRVPSVLSGRRIIMAMVFMLSPLIGALTTPFIIRRITPGEMDISSLILAIVAGSTVYWAVAYLLFTKVMPRGFEVFGEADFSAKKRQG